MVVYMNNETQLGPTWTEMVNEMSATDFIHPLVNPEPAKDCKKFHGVTWFRFPGAKLSSMNGQHVRYYIRGRLVTFLHGMGSPSYYARQADLIRLRLQEFSVRPRSKTYWNFSEAQARLDLKQEAQVSQQLEKMINFLVSIDVLPEPEQLEKLRIEDRARFHKKRNRATWQEDIQKQLTVVRNGLEDVAFELRGEIKELQEKLVSLGVTF